MQAVVMTSGQKCRGRLIYKMHVPSMDLNVTGHDEVREVIFGWLTDIGAQQELVNIVE